MRFSSLSLLTEDGQREHNSSPRRDKNNEILILVLAHTHRRWTTYDRNSSPRRDKNNEILILVLAYISARTTANFCETEKIGRMMNDFKNNGIT
jgi:hypothetical protein